MEITILLSGKTGAGKSHLVNALTGKNLAKEGNTLDPETFEVSYEFEPELGKKDHAGTKRAMC